MPRVLPRSPPVARLVLSFAFALLAFLLAEGLVRALAGPAWINDVQIADADLGHRLPSGIVQFMDEHGSFSVSVNSSGFRGPELPPPGSKSGTTERVLLIGDSFLNGARIRDEDWVRTGVLDELSRAGRQAEVFALGIDDFGTGQELIALRKFGPRVQPDHVVLLVFPGNDLLNNTLEMAGRSRVSPNDFFRPYLVPDEDGDFVVRYAQPWRALLRHSEIYRHLESRWLAGRSRDWVREELTGEPEAPFARLAAGLPFGEHEELFLPAQPGSRWDIAWKRTEGLLLAFRDEARRLGADFMAVVIPSMPQVERTATWIIEDRDMRAAGWEDPAEYFDFDLPERRLEQFFHENGVAHVVLLGPLRRSVRETGKSTYLRDSHLNGSGQRLMSALIGARLASNGSGGTVGKDVCHEFAGGPVEILALLGGLPLVLDFRRSDHWPFLAWGWDGWTPPAARGVPGWSLAKQGTLVVPAGFATLEGSIVPETAPAVELSLVDGLAKRTLARVVLEPGPFRTSFVIDPVAPARGEAAQEWHPLSLALVAAPRNRTAAFSLVLQELRVEAAPPPEWEPGPVPAKRHTRALPLRRFVRVFVHLPVQFLALTSWGFVPVLHHRSPGRARAR